MAIQGGGEDGVTVELETDMPDYRTGRPPRLHRGLFGMSPGGMPLDLMRHCLDGRLNQSNHFLQGFASIVKDLV